MNGRILVIAAITASVSLNNLFGMMSSTTIQRPATQFGALAAQRAAATTLPRFYSTGPSSPEIQTPPVEPSSFDNQIRRGRAGVTDTPRFGSFGSFPRQSTSYFGSTALRSQNFKRPYSAKAFGNLDITEKSTSYEILGVATNASPKQINDAYKKLAAKYHPDVNQGKTTEEMKIINEAKDAALSKKASMSFNPSASQYTSSSSSQSQQRSSTHQAKDNWWERASQGGSQSGQSQSQSHYESEQEFLRRYRWEIIKQLWSKLNPFQKVVVGSLAGLVFTTRFALAHKKKIAAVTLAYYAYKNYSEGKAKESAKKLYEQHKSTMDQLGFDEYWHTHEITDQALADIARKNFAKKFISENLGEYTRDNAEKFRKKYGITVDQVDEKWMRKVYWSFHLSPYSSIINQLDALQKSRDKIFNKTSGVSLKDQLTKNIYKEIADALQSYRRWSWVPGYK